MHKMKKHERLKKRLNVRTTFSSIKQTDTLPDDDGNNILATWFAIGGDVVGYNVNTS